MNSEMEEIIIEANNITAALEFLSDAIECHDAEGREINAGGVACLLRLLGQRFSRVPELCWRSESYCAEMTDSEGGA